MEGKIFSHNAQLVRNWLALSLKWFNFALTDGVPSEPVHLPGGYVYRQFGAFRERGPDPLLIGVRLPEYYPDIENHSGMWSI